LAVSVLFTAWLLAPALAQKRTPGVEQYLEAVPGPGGDEVSTKGKRPGSSPSQAPATPHRTEAESDDNGVRSGLAGKNSRTGGKSHDRPRSGGPTVAGAGEAGGSAGSSRTEPVQQGGGGSGADLLVMLLVLTAVVLGSTFYFRRQRLKGRGPYPVDEPI
jgi:hypothetical protein